MAATAPRRSAICSSASPATRKSACAWNPRAISRSSSTCPRKSGPIANSAPRSKSSAARRPSRCWQIEMKELPDRTPLAFLAFLLMCPVARACDCALDPTPCMAFTHTAVIFAGRVSRISNIEVSLKSGDPKIRYPQRSVTFEVLKAYRGLQAKTVDVSTGEGGGDCGYLFERGREYLVYANPNPDTVSLSTGICQRTRLLSEARDDIDYLSRRDYPALGAGIEGMVEE